MLAEDEPEAQAAALRPLVPDILFELADGHPIDFLRYDPAAQQFALEPEAQEFLLEFGGHVCFVMNMGQRRVGKTAFFNRCLDIAPPEACFREAARGFKLWSKPIYSAADNKHVFFVDCEGRDDETYQEFCWVFAFFFSSLLLFSTSGEVTDASWAEFRPLEAVAKKVVFPDTPADGNLHNVAHLAPRLCWVMRDFVPEEGAEAFLHPDAYMNAQLGAEGGDAYTKRQLSAFFPQRSCALVPPPGQPDPDGFLAAVAEESVRAVKDAIFSKVQVKLWSGVPLTARLSVYLMTLTVEQFCRGERLDFTRMFAEIARSEAQRYAEEALEVFEVTLRARLPAGNVSKGLEVFEALREARDVAARFFFLARDMLQRLPDASELIAQFLGRLGEAEAQALEAHEALAQEHNERLKDQLEVDCSERVAQAESNAKSVAKLLSDTLSVYATKSLGVDDISPVLILASTLLERGMQKFALPPAPVLDAEPREALDAVAKRKQGLMRRKEGLEREIAELKQSMQALQSRNEGGSDRLNGLKRDFEREVEKKTEYDKMLSRQKEEMESLASTLKRLQQKKKAWCGL